MIPLESGRGDGSRSDGRGIEGRGSPDQAQVPRPNADTPRRQSPNNVRIVPAKAVPAQTGQRSGLVKGQHPIGVIDDGSLADGQPGATATIVLGTSSGISTAAGTVGSPTTLSRGSLGSLGSGTGGHHKPYYVTRIYSPHMLLAR
jgi:hypothetical protein